MDENASVNDFYTKLSDIVYSSFNLGEPIAENKIAKKILRSIHERFHAKVVAIDENKDLDTLRVDQLVGD